MYFKLPVLNRSCYAALAILFHTGLFLVSCAPPTRVSVRDQVYTVERAFARSMAERSLQEFSTFISDEAIFFSGPGPLRGKTEVVAWWKQYFAGATAPFSWEPDEVEVLKSGTLALSSGPVRDTNGKIIARYTSIWRLEAPGQWRIIFDKGNPVAPAVTE